MPSFQLDELGEGGGVSIVYFKSLFVYVSPGLYPKFQFPTVPGTGTGGVMVWCKPILVLSLVQAHLNSISS